MRLTNGLSLPKVVVGVDRLFAAALSFLLLVAPAEAQQSLPIGPSSGTATIGNGGLFGATPQYGITYAGGVGAPAGITTPVANSVPCRAASNTAPTECTTLPSGLTIPSSTLTGSTSATGPITLNSSLVVGTSVPLLYAHGKASGSTGGAFTNFYVLATDTDTVAGGVTTLYVEDNLGGVGTTGNRNGIESFINIGSATSDGPGNNSFYTAVAGVANVSANLGGTSGNYGGNPFGANFVAHLNSGATFIKNAVAAEDDIQADTGSSVNYLVGHQIAITTLNGGDGAVAGNLEMAGITFSAEGTSTAKFSIGIGFGSPLGDWVFGSTSTLIGNLAGLGGDTSHIALYGVDFSAISFQVGGCAFKSSGFCVNPNGSETLSNAVASGFYGVSITNSGASGTAGVRMVSSASADQFEIETDSDVIRLTVFGVGDLAVWDRNGNFTNVGHINAANLPTSGSAAGSLCIDGSGNFFVKTTTGACK